MKTHAEWRMSDAVLFQRPAKGAGVDVPNLRLTPDELLALHQALQTYIDSDHENGADDRLQVCRRVHERVHNLLVWACSIWQRRR